MFSSRSFRSLFQTGLLFTLISLPGWVCADPFLYPKNKPAFQVDFPEGWDVKIRDGGTLVAVAPDRSSEVYFWKIKFASIKSVKSNAASYVSPVISDYEDSTVSMFYRESAGIKFSCFFGKGKLKSNQRSVRTAIAFYPLGDDVYAIGRISGESHRKFDLHDLDILDQIILPISKPLR